MAQKVTATLPTDAYACNYTYFCLQYRNRTLLKFIGHIYFQLRNVLEQANTFPIQCSVIKWIEGKLSWKNGLTNVHCSARKSVCHLPAPTVSSLPYIPSILFLEIITFAKLPMCKECFSFKYAKIKVESL